MSIGLINLAWGIGMLLGCLGWGSIWKGKPLWIQGCLGICTITTLGAWLDWAGLATSTNLTLMTGTGTLWLWKNKPRTRGLKKTDWPIVTIGLVLASVGSFASASLANWDDISGYWPVCLEMGAHGQSWAPLSLRRALTWGGQFPLQTIGMIWSGAQGGYVYERGLGIWMLALALTEKANKSWTESLLGGLAIWGTQAGINSAPQTLLVALLAAAWTERRNAKELGWLLGTICVMRTQMVAPAAMLAALSAWGWTKGGSIKEAAKQIGAALASGAIIILPLLWLYKTQFGNYAFFLTPSTIFAPYVTFKGAWEPRTLLSNLWITITTAPALGLFFTGGMIYKRSRALAAIGAGTWLIIIASMPEYSPTEWNRYAWPLAGSLAILLAAKRQWTVGTILMVLLLLPHTTKNIENYVERTRRGAEMDRANPERKLRIEQEKIPEGATILVLAGRPCDLDYRRNTILNWDGGPAVGNCPRGGDPKDYKTWMKAWGAEYLLTMNPGFLYENGETIKELWTRPLGPEDNLPHYRRVWFPDRWQVFTDLEKMMREEKGKNFHIIRVDK